MATMGEADCSLAFSKCMDFCQALPAFHFSLNMGHNSTFSLGKVNAAPVAKKKASPSTQRRNARLREEFLSKKRQSLATVNSPVDKATTSLFSCDQCDYNKVSEKGLRQHARMKRWKTQLEEQLPKSSSPATPESLRQIAESTRFTGSPLLHNSREGICPNCDGLLTSDQQCDDGSDGDEKESEEEQVAAKPKTIYLNPEDRAMYGMLLQMNASMTDKPVYMFFFLIFFFLFCHTPVTLIKTT